MVPWPEIITTVASGRRRFISASVSSPSRPGIQMSRKTRSGFSSGRSATASAPVPTAVTRYPSSSRTPRSDDWIDGSSSTIRMCSPAIPILLAPPQAERRWRAEDVLTGHASCSHGRGRARDGQVHHEATAARRVVLDVDQPAVLGHDLVDDRQAEPHAARLRREVGLEELVLVLGADAGPGVADDDAHARAP